MTLTALPKPLRNVVAATVALAVLIVALPFVIPLDSYRGRIEIAAQNATGRTLKIEGPLRLMFFPHLGFRAYRISLANVPGGRAPGLARAGDIEVSVRVLPLLSGHVAIEKVTLDKPVIALEVDTAGNPNWKFAPPRKARAEPGSAGIFSSVGFSGVDIRDGHITYDNAKTGSHSEVDHVNAETAISPKDMTASMTGDLRVDAQKIAFRGQLATLKSLFGGGTTSVGVWATSDLMQASFEGAFKPAGGAEGVFKLDTRSFRALLAALGEPLPGQGFNALSLQSRITAAGKTTTLHDLRLTLDGQHARGTLILDQRRSTPVVNGAVSVDRLDLNPYLAANGGNSNGQHATARDGWSSSPISFALLRRVDGDLTIDSGALRLRGLHFGKTTLHLLQSGGTLTARLDPVTLYGGTGHAELDVDARGRQPVLKALLAVRGIALKPFLADTLAIDSIEGVGQIDLSAASQGVNANLIMHSLSGRGSISASGGRFRGVDFGLVARSVRNVLGRSAAGENASTDFHSMGGTFAILNGVLSSDDFHLAGPVVQMTGRGQIGVGERTINFRLVPTAGVAGVSIGVPFRVYGSWDKVHYAPDFAGVLHGVLDSGSAALKNLFGGKAKQPDEKKNVGQELKDVFGLH